MDLQSAQLAEMLKELKSRSKARIATESGTFTLILLLCLLGNSITLLIMLKNRRMRVIPANIFVTSLAISDFALAALSSFSGFAVVLTSRWPYSELTCQFQGYLAITLAIASMRNFSLDGIESIFSDCQPEKISTLFQQN